MLSICCDCCTKLSSLERISNIKPFIYQYNWKEISFPSNENRLE